MPFGTLLTYCTSIKGRLKKRFHDLPWKVIKCGIYIIFLKVLLPFYVCFSKIPPFYFFNHPYKWVFELCLIANNSKYIFNFMYLLLVGRELLLPTKTENII